MKPSAKTFGLYGERHYFRGIIHLIDLLHHGDNFLDPIFRHDRSCQLLEFLPQLIAAHRIQRTTGGILLKSLDAFPVD